MAFGTMSIGNAGFTQKFVSTLFLLMHPVGTPYISENPTSPAELYGGTWERIEGQFIMGASDDYPAGSTGGEAEHKLTIREIADHTHSYRVDGKSGNPMITFPEWSWGMSYSVITQNKDKVTTVGAEVTHEGNGEPHNNIPPYYSMYIWRRVA